jgi:hypothetical protein
MVFKISIVTTKKRVHSIRLLVNVVRYEDGEPWWNDICRGILLIVQQSFCQSYQQSSGSKQEERAKEMMNLASRSIFLIFASYFYKP